MYKVTMNWRKKDTNNIKFSLQQSTIKTTRKSIIPNKHIDRKAND